MKQINSLTYYFYICWFTVCLSFKYLVIFRMSNLVLQAKGLAGIRLIFNKGYDIQVDILNLNIVQIFVPAPVQD